MRLIKMSGLLAAGAMTLGVFGVAAARTGSVLAPNNSLFGAPAAAIEAPREVELPPEQQLSLAHTYLGKMDQGATTVRAALEQARAARDVVKTLCLNDKLNQIDVANRSAKDRSTTLQAAVSSHDRDRARHEFMILQVLKDRVEQLVKEANQCIGEEVGFIGESLVSLTIDPGIPDNNTDQLGNDPEIISEPPVLASPLM
jgi:hypothetical protein